jgi:hypothetical protein
MTKNKIMMAGLFLERLDQFGHTITHQRRRIVHHIVVQGEGAVLLT